MQRATWHVMPTNNDSAKGASMGEMRAALGRLTGARTLGMLVVAAIAACGSSSRGMPGGPSGDVADAPEGAPGDGDPGGSDGSGTHGDAPIDAVVDYGWGGCGTDVVAHGDFTRAGELAIALDGTAYLSRFDAGKSTIARRVPGSPIELTWFDFGAVVGVNDMAVSPADGRIYMLVSKSGLDLEPRLKVLQPVAHPSAANLGQSIHSGGTLAFDSTGRLYAGSAAGGIWRVDLTTGALTPVVSDLVISALISADPTHLVAVTVTSGLIELTLDTAGAELSRQVIFPYTTRALQLVAIDQLGRYYATLHVLGPQSDHDELHRFAHDFTGEETLLSEIASSSTDFHDIAFGKGALACNIYISGFQSDRHVDGDTPGRP
jgi:hypothetical protein